MFKLVVDLMSDPERHSFAAR